MEEVPSDLIINWDQTSVHYIPISQWNMENKAKNINIVTFTSLALEGVHKRLSLYKVLTCSQGENNGLINKWDESKKKSNSKA